MQTLSLHYDYRGISKMQKRKISVILGVALVGLLAMSLVNEVSAVTTNISSDFQWSSLTITPVGNFRIFQGTLVPKDPLKNYTIDGTATSNSRTVNNCTSGTWSISANYTGVPPTTKLVSVDIHWEVLTTPGVKYSLYFNLMGEQVP